MDLNAACALCSREDIVTGHSPNDIGPFEVMKFGRDRIYLCGTCHSTWWEWWGEEDPVDLKSVTCNLCAKRVKHEAEPDMIYVGWCVRCYNARTTLVKKSPLELLAECADQGDD